MAERTPQSLAQKLLWFLALWLAGVASLAVLSLLLRTFLASN